MASVPEDYRKAYPTTARLVIEVAIATLGIDRAKADVYAAAGIEEYWIVIPETRSVEIYGRPSEAGYGSRKTISAEDSIGQPADGHLLPISIEWLFG